MKKTLITILFIACVAAAISLDKCISNNARAGSIPHSEEVIEASADRPVHYDDLLDVKGISSDAKIVEYTGYRAAFNHKNKTSEYVAWELTDRETRGNIKRSDKFWKDPKVKGCPDKSDYKGSGFDRGHLCPAADMKWSEKAMNDCFSMVNMTPQAHALNGGAWATLEDKCRSWAQRDSALIIVAGPIYEKSDTQTIGEARIRVPSAFYKVILAPYLHTPRAIGFIYPNMSSPGNMSAYAMSVDDVERYTGLDFFYNLPDSIEDAIEATFSFSDWNNYSRRLP